MTQAWLVVGILGAAAIGCGKSDSKGKGDDNAVRDHRTTDRETSNQAEAPASVAVIPYQVSTAELTFTSGARTIEGTLTRPDAPGTFPAVLLHAGSGPTDRDWNNPLMEGTNGSGKLLAEELTRAGFVVLRFDKLGTGKTTIPDPLTWDAVLDDARGGLDALRADAHADRDRMFVAGHSEGGIHAIGLARRENDRIAGVVLLASAGRTMNAIIQDQLEGQFRAAGISGDALEDEMRPIRTALDAFFAGKNVDPTTASKHLPVQQLVAQIVNPAGAAYARELYGFDPAEGVAQIEVPILVWNGAKDIQVSPEKDAKRLHDAATSHGVDSTLHISPDADHVLKHEPTPKDQVGAAQAARYNAADRTLDPDALEAIVGWLQAHGK